MRTGNKFITLALASVLALFGCTPKGVYQEGLIYPDYMDVTIPYNIAPLNFHYGPEVSGRTATTFKAAGHTVEIKGRNVLWDMETWKRLCEAAKGSDIMVTTTASDKSWTIHVSEDEIDSFLSYRLIEPGYEVWNEVEIRERNITNFDEKALSDSKNTNNSCMNCHIHSQGRADLSLMYVRGANGGAFLNRDGEIRKLNLRDKDMISSTVYGELHPSGRYGVFSTNIIIPGFHTFGSNRLEVYDTESDLVIADFDSNEMSSSPLVTRKDVFETFPVFSADGRTIYYCSADTVSLPENVKDLKYSLKSISFDEKTGRLGSDIKTVWDAEEHGGSVCHPKCSPDGRFLMYTVADYGTFPIWHRECDLELMDLSTGKIIPMDEANSDRSDTYHSWSSSSRWFVFASKRGDGQYGKPYFCHIDENGNVTKPFVLPQKDSYHYDKTLKSFNIPDLSKESVNFDAETIGQMVREMKAEEFR